MQAYILYCRSGGSGGTFSPPEPVGITLNPVVANEWKDKGQCCAAVPFEKLPIWERIPVTYLKKTEKQLMWGSGGKVTHQNIA